MEKYIEYLNESNRKLKISNHLIYSTLPLIKEKRLFVSILNELNLSLINLVKATLSFHKIKMIKNDELKNMNEFFSLCKNKYNLDTTLLNELYFLTLDHKNSSVEIFDKNRVVILSSQLKSQTLTVQKIKLYFENLRNSIEFISQITQNSPQISNK